MAPTFLYVFGLTIFLIMVASLIIQISKLKKPEIRSRSLPPGKTGWPLIGETLDYVSCPGKFVRDRMMVHSPEVFKTSFAGEKTAFFCGPSANKFLFSNEGKLVTNWLPSSVAHGLGLSRTNLDSPAFRLLVKQLRSCIQEGSQQYVPVINAKIREHVETNWLPYDEVKVHPLSKELAFSLACGLLINYHSTEQVKELAEPFYILVKGILSAPINIPGTTYYRAMKAAKVVRELLGKVVRYRKMELWETADIDLSGRLFMAILESCEPENDEDEIVGKLVSLLFAGFHTYSNTITFLLDNLATQPEIYRKVLEEQLDIAHSKMKGELLNWKDIQKMKYSWNVVCESMRLNPPAVGGFRQAMVDFTYKGFTIPKGWKVHWSTFSTNKDPQYFPDPENFDPTRFEGNNIAPYAFVPFGSGPRMCVGREFARVEILVFMFNIVTRFRLRKVNPDEKVFYTPDPVPAEGLRIYLERHDE